MAEYRRPDRPADKSDEKTANAWSTPTNGSDLGKKSSPKTSAVTWPYSRKSYHSIAVPTVLAIMARRKCVRCSVSERSPAVISAVVIELPPNCRALSETPVVIVPRRAAVGLFYLGDRVDRGDLTFLTESSPRPNAVA